MIVFQAWLSAKNSFSRQLKLKQKAIEAEKEKVKNFDAFTYSTF
jgi:hypothetical protein